MQISYTIIENYVIVMKTFSAVQSCNHITISIVQNLVAQVRGSYLASLCCQNVQLFVLACDCLNYMLLTFLAKQMKPK